MECACDIDIDGEGPSCSKEKIRTARKEHRCCECHRTIKPGERYEYTSGIWDGSPSAYKTCLDCKSLRDVFFRSWIFTMIWDDFYEEFRGEVVPESCIAELTPGARSMVCDWIEEQWLWEDTE